MHATEKLADNRSVTDAELDQVSGGMFSFALLAYRMANKGAAARDFDDVLVSANAANGHV